MSQAVVRSAVLAVVAAVLTGCPTSAVVCQAGTEPCGSGCIDPAVDARNCGGCGIACGANQRCVDSRCTCQAGTTSCGGECVVTAVDSTNCGRCGAACLATQVCEQGACRASCTVGSTALCGSSCIDITSDVNNCGGCARSCSAAQTCRAGACTHDVVAACARTGQLAGLDATALTRGVLSAVGSEPVGLAAVPGGVLVLDGAEGRLLQAAVTPQGLVQARRANTAGAGPGHVVVDGELVFVVNTQSATLEVLRRDGPDAGVVVLDGGVTPFPAGIIGTLALPAGSSPRAPARLGGSLWIPLYGGEGALADAGPAVVEVSLADPSAPVELRRISLAGLAARALDGGAAVARPAAVVSRNDAGYVVLSAVDRDSGAPAGPGLLARVEPASGAVSAVSLGDRCVDPRWATPVGGALAVSCAGRATGGTLAGAGVVLVEGDSPTTLWSSTCSSPTLADGGACTALRAGRMTAKGTRLFVADDSGGRVAVLEVGAASLTEIRRLDVCPGATPSVSDIVTLP